MGKRAEKKRRQRQIVAMNRKIESTVDRLKLLFKNGEMMINDQKHTEPVTTPTTSSVLL